MKLYLYAGFLSLLISVSILCGCANFYKINERASQVSKIDSLANTRRIFILRTGSESFVLKQMVVDKEQQTLSGVLDTLPVYHLLHTTRSPSGKMRYRRRDPTQTTVLKEVHLYTKTDTAARAGVRYSLPMNIIEKIEVLERDAERSTTSYVLGGLGIAAGSFAIVMAIAAALKTSCPFVSAHHNGVFYVQGEIYGGAIYPQLARQDLLPLKMSPLEDGSLQLKISNELHERQYTDFADLLVVTHPTHARVLNDDKGNLFTISEPKTPVQALLNSSKDVLKPLLKESDDAMLSMNDTATTNGGNELWLKFDKPLNAKEGKLVLTLKNSYWLDLLYGELAKGFGSYYNTYVKEQRKKPASELNKWVSEQQIPLKVSVKTNGGWKVVTEVPTIGPVANRTIVVPLEFGHFATKTAEVKLESGFMFWELDYTAIDFTANDMVHVQQLSPASAIDENGKNVLPVLEKQDGVFLEQPEIGNVATLVYKNFEKPKQGHSQTYFLKAKGYYEHIRQFNHKPDVGFLKQFTRPNAFPQYGVKLYKQIAADPQKAIAQSN